jgi:hypothetical protein
MFRAIPSTIATLISAVIFSLFCLDCINSASAQVINSEEIKERLTRRPTRNIQVERVPEAAPGTNAAQPASVQLVQPSISVQAPQISAPVQTLADPPAEQPPPIAVNPQTPIIPMTPTSVPVKVEPQNKLRI